MKIGIDTDGVLTDLYAYNYNLGKNVLKKKLVNPSGYNMEEMFGVGIGWKLIHGLKCFFQYCKEWEPREHAAEMIQKLNQDGHQLYEITARKFVMMRNPLGSYSRRLLEDWYQKHGMEFRKIVYCSESGAPQEKYKACVENNCHIMIEDKPDVAEYLIEKGIKVILFDAPYNQAVTGKLMVRVHDWLETYEVIQTIIAENN